MSKTNQRDVSAILRGDKRMCKTTSAVPTRQKFIKGRKERTLRSPSLDDNLRRKSHGNLVGERAERIEIPPRSKKAFGRISPRSLLDKSNKDGEFIPTPSLPNLNIFKRKKKKVEVDISQPNLQDHSKGKKEAYPFWLADSGGRDILTRTGIPSDESSDAPFWACRKKERYKRRRRKGKRLRGKKTPEKENMRIEDIRYHPLRSKRNQLDIISKERVTVCIREEEHLAYYGFDKFRLNDLISACSLDDILHEMESYPIEIIYTRRFVRMSKKTLFQPDIHFELAEQCKIISDMAFIILCRRCIVFGNDMEILKAEDSVIIGNVITVCAIGCILIGNNFLLLEGSKNNRDESGKIIPLCGVVNCGEEDDEEG